MAWTAPVTDRTEADIEAKNSKAYMNVADWLRILDDIVVVHNLLYYNYGLDFFDYGTVHNYDASTDDVPTAEDLATVQDTFILQMMYGGNVPSSLFGAWWTYEWKAYTNGPNGVSPDYVDFNGMESALLVLYEALPKAVAYQVQCGVGQAGQGRLRQNMFRRIAVLP